MVASVSKTPFTSFFPISFHQQFSRSAVISSFELPFCVLLVDSVPRTIFGKTSETYINEDLHNVQPWARAQVSATKLYGECLMLGGRADVGPFRAFAGTLATRCHNRGETREGGVVAVWHQSPFFACSPAMFRSRRG